jgi:hypothetical protein
MQSIVDRGCRLLQLAEQRSRDRGRSMVFCEKGKWRNGISNALSTPELKTEQLSQ